VNNNSNSNTVVKQDFAVVKQVDGRAPHMTDTTRHQSTPPPTRSCWIHPWFESLEWRVQEQTELIFQVPTVNLVFRRLPAYFERSVNNSYIFLGTWFTTPTILPQNQVMHVSNPFSIRTFLTLYNVVLFSCIYLLLCISQIPQQVQEPCD
jgi:hypothetical protein